MFCPVCRDEYQPARTRCEDCAVPLVASLPDPAPRPPVRIVTALATGDPVRLAAAKSFLESAGVDYWVRGEGLQDLFGVGRLGAGFNVTIGPMLLQVDEQDLAEATDILAEVAPDRP